MGGIKRFGIIRRATPSHDPNTTPPKRDPTPRGDRFP